MQNMPARSALRCGCLRYITIGGPGTPKNRRKSDEILAWFLEGLRGGTRSVLGAFGVPLGPPKGPKIIEKSLPELFFPSFFLDLLFTSIFL